MTEEQKKLLAEQKAADEAKAAAEAQAAAEAEAKAKADAEAAEGKALAERDARIAQLEEERNNYKNVALKRLGKLPGDAEFITEEELEKRLATEETVKNILLEREIAKEKAEKEIELKRIVKENAELRLALKNQPGRGMGGDSGTSGDVKDNTFSTSQIDALHARAKSLGLDPVKYVEAAKKNMSRNR